MKNILSICILFFGFAIFAQTNKVTFINKLRCGTDQLHRELLNSDPSIREAQDYFENVIMPIAKNNTNRQFNVVYQVPVVVHVVHKGEAVGVGSNISDADVKLGIKYLNNFWRKIAGSYGDGGGVDMQIEFALAVRDPNGNCTSGIVRKDLSGNATYVASGVKLSSTSGITDATLKSSSRWDPLKYYNVYVVDEIDNKKCGDPNGWTAGYAFFASSHGNTTDGAVMLNCSYLDATDVTFAHEMGHAFNLYHTFEGDRDTNADGTYESCPTNTAGTACGSGVGDCCADIPAHVRTIDIPNLYTDCGNTTSNTCVAGTTHQNHMLNYMDYTGCANEFTANQQTRAVAALTGTRSSFLQSTGNQSLVPPAVATVDFLASSNVACTGSTIAFTDNSGCTPNAYTNNGFPGVSFSWTFTNNAGTVLTSTLQNPVITFATAGTYDVTLAITNASGTTTLTKTGFIRVAASPVAACVTTSVNVGNFWQTIYNVKLNTINKTTSQYINAAYSDFSCSSNTILTEGLSYPISVAGNAGNGLAEVFEVRIDYNNNGSFNDANEMVYSGSIAAGAMSTLSGSFTVPLTAVKNTLLRMRVIGEAGTISTNERNCNASSDKFEVGDVEDYGIYIISACTSPTITGTLSACVGATSQLTGSGTAATTNPWTSSAINVATVSATGLVTALSAGTTTITYLNNAGCSTTATYTVTAGPTITGTLSACIGGTSQLTGSGTAATTNPWTSSATAIATVSNTGLVTAVASGTTTITYLNSTGCSSTVTFTVSAAPTISGTLSACVGGTSQLTGSGTPATTNTWTSSATGVATISTTGLVTAVSAGTTTITYRNSAGCSATATFTVTAGPTITGNSSVCVGATTQLTGSGTAATTNPWTSSATNIATVSTNGLVTGVAAGTTTITYRNSFGCNATLVVTVNAIPIIATIASQTICSGQPVAAVNFTSTPSGATFNWTNSNTSNGLAASGSSNIASYTAPVTTTAVNSQITVTATLNNCVSNPAQFSININPNPTITGTLSSCVGATSQLIGSGTAATTNPWTSSATSIATVSTSGLVTAVTSGITTITYKNNNGCTITSTFTVSAGPTISGTLSACVGTTSQLTGSGTAATTNAWTSSSQNVATISSSGLVTAVSIGTATITYLNNSGCSSTAIFTVNATPTISGTLSSCVGQSTLLTGSGTQGVNAWTSSATSVATVTASGTVFAVASGTTTITYINNTGCSTTAIYTVNPNPIISGTLTSCIGATSQLTGSGTAATTNPWTSSTTSIATVSNTGLVTAVASGTTTITYKNNNGCTVTSTFTVSAGPSITGTLSACVGATSQLTGSGTAATTNPWTSSAINVATVSATGLVTGVSVGATSITYLNNLGCSATATFTVNAIPVVSSITSQTVCSGQPVAATNFTSVPSGATFSWTNSNTLNGLAASGTGNIASYTAPSTTSAITSQITVTATLNNCASNPAPFSITINPLPNANFTLPSTACLNQPPVTLIPVQTGGVFSGNGVNQNTFSPLISGSGTFAITYSITQNNCSNTSMQSITVSALDNATFSINDVCFGTATQATITGVQGGTFSIAPNTNGETISSSGIITNGVAGTTYTITYTTPSGGCQNTSTDNVTLFSLPAAPTITLVNDTLRTIANASSYLWFLNGNPTGITTSYFVPGTISGNYQVQVTNANGCSSTSTAFAYQFTGITNADLSKNKIIIYPNPANDFIYFETTLNTDNIHLKIVDVMGRPVFMKDVNTLTKNENAINLNVEWLESAIYFIEITENGKLIQNGKIIIQH